MKVIGYCRISSKSQEDNTSLEGQREAIESYCKALNYELLAVVEEVGTGSSATKRPEFQKAVNLVLENEDIGGIITAKLDRFARSLKDLTNIVDTLHEKGKFLICFGDNINTKDANSQLLMGILGSVAEWERKKINERIRTGIKNKVQKTGKLHSKPSEKNPKVITLEEVKEWKKMREQGLSLRKIAEEKNRHFNSVARILKRA